MTRNNKICDNKMDFSECELAILRMQVDKAQEKIAKRAINTPEIQKIITTVEQFIKKKKLIQLLDAYQFSFKFQFSFHFIKCFI